MCDEHGDARAVLGGIEDLAGGILIRVKVHISPFQQGGLSGDHVVAVRGGRYGKGLEGIEGLGVGALAAKAAGRAQAGQGDVTDKVTGERVELDLGGDVLEIRTDQQVVDHIGPLEQGLGFGNNLPPVFRIGLTHVDRNDAALGGLGVGAEVEDRAVIVHEAELVIKGGDHVLRHGKLLLQILDHDTVLGVCADPDREDKVSTVVSDLCLIPPFRMIGPKVHCHVITLRSAEAVVHDLHVLVQGLKLLIGVRVRILGVEEPLCLGIPGHVRELQIGQFIREVLARVYVSHPPGTPVRPGLLDAVGHITTVVAEGQSAQGHGAVF